MSALLLGPFLLASLFVGWLVIQGLWRHIFNLDSHADVLADRGCCNCPRADDCQNRQLLNISREKGHGS